jgi:hypothetical protein
MYHNYHIFTYIAAPSYKYCVGMHLSIFVNEDMIQFRHYTTPSSVNLHSIFETLCTLITQGPRMLLCDWRIERN